MPSQNNGNPLSSQHVISLPIGWTDSESKSMLRKLPEMHGLQQTSKMGIVDTSRRWWYKATFHYSIWTPPFKALYGYDPPQLKFQQQWSTNTPAMDNFLKDQRVTVLERKYILGSSEI